MKIAILSLRSRFGDVTGDCVQAAKTVDALKAIGQDAERYYLDAPYGKVYDSENRELGDWQTAMRDMDIIHTLPPIPIANLTRHPKVRAKLVTSTVFWSSPTYWKVVLMNTKGVDLNLIKALIREGAAKMGIKLRQRCLSLNGSPRLLHRISSSPILSTARSSQFSSIGRSFPFSCAVL